MIIKISKYLIFLVIIFSGCNKRNLNLDNKTKPASPEDNSALDILYYGDNARNKGKLAVPRGDHVIISKKSLNGSPGLDADIPISGIIIANERFVTPGDEYLKLLAKGMTKAPNIISTNDIKNIDLDEIHDGSKQVPLIKALHEQKISSASDAYARYMNIRVPLGWTADVQCRGVYETNKCYYLFFGVESELLEKYIYSYFINKSDGKVFEYVR